MIDLEKQKSELLRGLINKGISDKNVLKAFAEVPREEFVSDEYYEKAYEDHALPLAAGQTISQPYTVAYMTELLNLKNDDKVLEIGTGSGYQAAILYKCNTQVFTVERIPELYERSKIIFERLNYNIHQKLDDGNYGWLENAPYDGIIITAALSEFPVKLMKQLKTGGNIVFPIGSRDSQTMNAVKKLDEKHYKQEKKEKFKFVPLIGSYGWKE